eukprot:761777-Hanusia_phi.AAC.5
MGVISRVGGEGTCQRGVMVVWGLVAALAAAMAGRASAGCCQLMFSNVAVIWDMWKKSEVIRMNLLATADAQQPVPTNDQIPGCCLVGPEGTCNWRCGYISWIAVRVIKACRRDCCNFGTGGYWVENAVLRGSICETYRWVVGPWSACPDCGVANITRSVTCQSNSNNAVQDSALCADLGVIVQQHVAMAYNREWWIVLETTGR